MPFFSADAVRCALRCVTRSPSVSRCSSHNDVFLLFRLVSKFFSFGEIRGRCAHLRNGPNPEIGHCAGRYGDLRGMGRLLWVRVLWLTGALDAREHIERPEEIAGDGAVVAKIHLPTLGRPGHEADSDCVVRA